MDRVEFYSGESVGSSDLFADPNDNSGQFAFNASDLYNYNYNNRQQYASYTPFQNNYMNPPPQQQYMGFGYNQPNYGYQQNYYGYPQQQYGAPMNTPYMPYNPYQANPYQPNNSQIMNPNQINTGYVGSPAIGMINQWQQRPGTPYYQNGWYDPYNQQVVQQAPVQDQTVFVNGFNPTGSVGLLTSDAEEICAKMQVDMMMEQQAAIAKRQQRSQGYFNANIGGYNYYGMPLYSQFDTGVYQKYMNKLQEMKQQAIDRRLKFNKNLSRMCHNFLKDGTTDSDIDRIYDGYSYTIPGASIVEYRTQEKLKQLVPFNNAWMYQRHSAEVSALYHMIAPPGRNMNEFFQDAGLFFTLNEMEKEYHRRRNTQNYYDTDIYHEHLRKFALEHDIEIREKKHTRETAERLADLAISKGGNVTKKDIIEALYTPQQLEEMSKNGFVIGPDGSISLNAQLPNTPMRSSNTPEIISENELDYEMRRSAFIASIYNNGNSSQAGG